MTPAERWVDQVARTTRPERVVWCDGSEEESRRLVDGMVADGLDALAAHHDRLVVPRRVGSAVEKRAGPDEGHRGLAARTFRPFGRSEESDDEKRQERQSHTHPLGRGPRAGPRVY